MAKECILEARLHSVTAHVIPAEYQFIVLRLPCNYSITSGRGNKRLSGRREGVRKPRRRLLIIDIRMSNKDVWKLMGGGCSALEGDGALKTFKRDTSKSLGDTLNCIRDEPTIDQVNNLIINTLIQLFGCIQNIRVA